MTMPARAIWKGSLVLSAESVPVKLYAAIEDRTLHFHVLEKSTMTRIKQHMVNPETGDEIPREQVQHGYETEKGVYVLLTGEEIASLQPQESRNIEITRFVPASRISQQWYDRPYYLGPDEGSATSYFALAGALEHENREGIGHWVMRNQRYVGALRSEAGYLMLITMKFAEEVLTADELPRPNGRAPEPKELRMAEQLVSALADEFRPEDYRDEYRERVMKFVEAKAHGEKPRLKVVARRKKPKSLVASLAASLNIARRAKEKRVA